MQAIDHPEVKRWVKLITPGTRFTWNEEQPVFTVSTKVRSIDPPVMIGNSVTSFSSLDHAFSRYRSRYLSSKQGLWPMGIVKSPGA